MKDYKMKDHTNYPTSGILPKTKLELQLTIPSYEELETKVWQLEHELDKSQSESYTLEADYRLLKSEYEDLKSQMIKDSLYAELGRFVYDYRDKFKFYVNNDNLFEHYRNLKNQIQESEAGDAKI